MDRQSVAFANVVTTTQDRPAVAPAVIDRPGTARTALTLGAFVALGPLTIDMYLPALPTIADDLRTNSATVQLTLTGTLVGLALGQLVLGPLSDALGRRRPLLAGLAVYIVTSAAMLFADSITVFTALRFVQGFSAAAGMVLSMAILRDSFDGIAVSKAMARLMLVVGVAPVLAPTIGAELLRFGSWRVIFGFLTVAGALLLALAAARRHETAENVRRDIFDDIDRWTGDAERGDDQTLVILKVIG